MLLLGFLGSRAHWRFLQLLSAEELERMGEKENGRFAVGQGELSVLCCLWEYGMTRAAFRFGRGRWLRNCIQVAGHPSPCSSLALPILAHTLNPSQALMRHFPTFATFARPHTNKQSGISVHPPPTDWLSSL